MLIIPVKGLTVSHRRPKAIPADTLVLATRYRYLVQSNAVFGTTADLLSVSPRYLFSKVLCVSKSRDPECDTELCTWYFVVHLLVQGNIGWVTSRSSTELTEFNGKGNLQPKLVFQKNASHRCKSDHGLVLKYQQNVHSSDLSRWHQRSAP